MAPTRRQISADSALMCIDKKVIALKAVTPGTAGDNLQVFNLDTKTKLKAYQMPETVEYWKWINPNMLGLVTAGAVYHWSIEGAPDAPPIKVFERTPNLAGAQIISYRTTADLKWSVLIGITAVHACCNACQAVVCDLEPTCQALPSQTLWVGAFHAQCLNRCLGCTYPGVQLRGMGSDPGLTGRDFPSNLIAFAQKTLKDGAIVSKLHVIELGGAPGKSEIASIATSVVAEGLIVSCDAL
ncbi:hypothetical protein DUNSADRAFT_5734 [Dunaliella salina]|uniref:Uncharacterized protein n=1 Tax=Dunaliella salina TaxID=3046 RepID=A0ABQ7FU49_DUNSA|nr:hypothetical protein DUNSADRAFT_5734 [Dunaliella salina]|eukprot:KAF5825943.1 hypothetical protein DUNSADRAFT_5734 [Dunaliella salina]